MSPSQPSACETEPQFCGELIGLRDKVKSQESRLTASINLHDEASRLMHTVADRVGVMRPDGTCTPHSLTAAVQTNTNEVLSLRRIIEECSASDPPRSMLSALDDDPVTEITRADIQRPVHTSRKLRTVQKQRNWIAVGMGIGLAIAGVIEGLRLGGVLK